MVMGVSFAYNLWMGIIKHGSVLGMIRRRKMKGISLLIIALAISFAYIGCEYPQKAVAPVMEEEVMAEEAVEMAPEAAMIKIQESEKMAAELWSVMQDAKYRENWKMWPGKEALYEGTVPHGVFLTTYVNDAAHNAIVNKAGMMPYGAMIIKENYKPDKSLAAFTVMHKVKGFNPEAGDWFWAKLDPDGKVMRKSESSAKLEVLPGEIHFPIGFENKIAYDPDKKLLIFKGVMSEEERVTLQDLSKHIIDQTYRKQAALRNQYNHAINELFQGSQVTSLAGKVGGCIQCHSTRSENGYVFTGSLK